MTQKKMGSMKLSEFSGIKNQREMDEISIGSEDVVSNLPLETPSTQETVPTPDSSPPHTPFVKEKPVTINIKITRAQHEWLTDTARIVRENNDSPVPPMQRVYPQHLIGVAVELLQASCVDWSKIKNVEDLKHQLNL